MQMQGGGGAGDSSSGAAAEAPRPSRYESQKRRDWHTFGQYLRNHRPPLELSRCSGAHPPAHTHHFFIPHPQFLHHHGHFSLVPAPNAVSSAAISGATTTTVSSNNGDEIALAMAAAAEAHAAGCMLPLSVFH
ncbi:hypothetical protein PR202_gb28194 [Eleusine coracana subsp. coracana]|uniref:ALOG domain-containing protein n=1 Tax=Eleusine coracana subsp. coracana TaxID=191504 RepID=A0AAV5FWH3_ELECO|nr:hypothetical protein PR202_gb28194 [Eleusine coracana subsp. coracana]